MKGETGSTLEVGKSEGIVDQMQECRHNVPAGVAWGSNGMPPGGGVHTGYALPPRAPNDPPETWLDRTARAAMAGMLSNSGRGLTVGPDSPNDNERVALIAYALAAAMFAEKMRREKKEVEE